MSTAHRVASGGNEPVAIVGMACLLPGADSPEQFWDGLIAGADHRTEGGRDVFGTDPDTPGGWGDDEYPITTTRGGFVAEPEIDLTGLAVPADDLAGQDRVVRWSLHTVRQALADAGLDRASERLGRTGLVLGNYSFPTDSSVDLCVPQIRRAVTEGLARAGLPVPAADSGQAREPAAENLWPFGSPAVTTADALGLGGPRLALDAACSSALYGMSLARDYLATGRADTMVAGAVCVPDPLLIHLSFSDLHAYPDNGVAQPFDADSTGILTGQGAGVFVLKRLADAVRDGDRIHAVLESIGLTNDGAGKHLLSPSSAGQIGAYERAYTDLDPAAVQYIECHATGTPRGDATELSGLAEYFGQRAGTVPLLGSVKGNVGHLLTVAGFTSALKTVLSLRHGVIPGTPGVTDPRRPAGAEAAADRIVLSNQDWPEHDGPRRAAVSAFGFGGTNAHLVLAEPTPATTATSGETGAADRGSDPQHRLAVVGLGARLGPLADAEALARAARTGQSALVERPEHRWYGAEHLADGPLTGTAIDGTDPVGGYFDTLEAHPRTYRIPPNELAQANPQHLALFEAAEQALADAGYPPPPPGSRADELPESRVAVVIAMEMEPRSHTHRARFDIGAHVRAECDRAGVSLDPEQLDRLEAAVRGAVHDPIGANEVLSYIGNIMASRVSSSRNLTGPSFTVAADATAGARALEVAELLLLDPTIEAVLVGGVDLAAGAENTRARARIAADRGEGPPPLGDGAAALVVTREDAVGEARRAYAAVEALRIHTADTAADAAAGAARAALDQAGLDPADVGYFELGGAGTERRLAETDALASVYRADDPGDRYSCALGSTTALVGDTGRAAPLAALVSATLALHHAEYPPAPPGLFEGEPDSLADGRFTMLGESQPWLLERRGDRRAAALSVLGETAAAHVILRSPAPRTEPAGAATDWTTGPGAWLLPLNADDGAGLAAAAGALRTRLAETGDPAPLVREAAGAPRPGRLTAVLVGADADRLEAELAAAERDLPKAAAEGREWSTPSGSYFTARPAGPDGRVAFVYPGAFTTYPGAGRDLFRLFPGLRADFEREADRPAERFKHRRLYPRSAGPMPRRDLMRHESELIEDTPVMLAAGTNFAVVHTRLLRDVLGIEPHGGFGYSLGESSMLFATGVWTESARDDAALAASPLFKNRLRGRKERVREEWDLPEATPDAEVWTTKVLLTSPDEARGAMSGLDRVYLTHVNTPGEVVVAGAPAQVRAVIEKLGCQSARPPADHVMHCPIVAPDTADLAALNDYPLGEPASGLELLSAYDYGTVPVGDRAVIADRIACTLSDTIDFARLARTAHDRGFRYFIEVGPGATCTRWITETLDGLEHVAVSVDRRGAATGTVLAQALARLVSHGLPVDLGVLFGDGTEAPARRSPVVRVPCGGEPIADRVAGAAADLLGPSEPHESTEVNTTMTSESAPTAPEPSYELTPYEPASAAHDQIVIEGEPFVHLAEPEPARAEPAGRPRDFRAPWRTGAAPDAGRFRPLQVLAANVARAHRAALHAQHAMLEGPLQVLEGPMNGSAAPPPAPTMPPPPAAPAAPASPPAPAVGPPPPPPATGDGGGDRTVIWDQDDLLEFAGGHVAPVFGPDFAEVDRYPRRCRLPEPPYHFVTRVTHLKGETGVFEPSEITTEYDVPADAWYTVDGLVPCAVTIEAGQCDMLLIAYLGVDFKNRGERVYRLLDSRLVFHGGLPREGQTLRYDINIDRFVWNGDSLLFFFNYRCYADGELILELLDACAGFFSPAELEESLGVVESAAEAERREAMTPAWFKPLARTDRTGLTGADLQRLTEGRPGEVFGPSWDQHADGVNPSLRLPDAKLRMIDEITSIDRLAGPRTLGHLTAVKRLDPDGWYFACHFTGDPVLAGSLIAEGGVQILQTYALYLGMHMVFPDAEFQAVPGLETEVKVRGQITPDTGEVRYEVDVTDLAMLPRPTVIADITVYEGDKPIVSMKNFGIRVQEKPGTPYRPEAGGIPAFLGRRNREGEAAFINELHLAHAAKGDLATAMGKEFEIYSDGRRAPYIPNGDFQFVDRIMRLDGTRGDLTPGSTMATEYDSPPEAWYYRDTGRAGMPNCVAMETSLQAAILLGYYLGATLASPDEELSIRNLDGRAAFVEQLDLRGKTIRHESELLSSQSVPGATLQNFRYRLYADGELFYEGESLFGYFTEQALANQVGLDSGEYVAPWLETHRDAIEADAVRWLPVRGDDRWFTPQPGTGLRLVDGHLRDLVDDLTIVPDGGDHGAGYLFGRREIDPGEWYFDCHFHRDPVMPGSLGVEAVLQALQAYVIESGLADGMGEVRFVVPRRVPMSWKYRGQILRGDGEMTFDAHIKEINRADGRLTVTADASVWKPGLRIYELTDAAVEVVPTQEEDHQ
ncbi:beta-ketoacyl synthase N-terminal-like domain-containing protein [Glycomyces xiaoerkulensis]|uniref:beta-ketoacyl synthase N-terminal-like domain-containing protein n=1 Tax=Glycomyces xiaoerkulensis TaxID=2038139 RepID=UPI000C258C07|nr:beta-ketoacyl synthase N-terminal-like domain-containing protein [Glycomyces xiaoerkulensis]